MEKSAFNKRSMQTQFEMLLRRKKEIQPEYENLRIELDSLNRQISGVGQALEAAGVDTYKIREKLKPVLPVIEPPRKKNTVPEMIQKMLLAYKRPMHYTEILRHLDTNGIHIGGSHRENTVLAYISRNKLLFERAPDKGRGYYRYRGGLADEEEERAKQQR